MTKTPKPPTTPPETTTTSTTLETNASTFITALRTVQFQSSAMFGQGEFLNEESRKDGDFALAIDPVHLELNPQASLLCKDVWEAKYRYSQETYEEMCLRVANAIASPEKRPELQRYWSRIFKDAMLKGLWMPAGRILAGAGTPKRVTLLNCFVNSVLEDDMESITHGLSNIMLTMQQGGGIGTDFSPLRPPGALLRRTGSTASGPGPFIDTWDSACTTIRSSGDRRGAMMGTLHCSHPYLPEFIKVKHEKGKWTNFNVSVLVSDAFMACVEDNEDWYLHHPCPPGFERPPELEALDFEDDEGEMQFVYSVHKARDLWDQIIRSTYDYAEPGVIFIDRVNSLNPLSYIETISCTNPCGEQPLPPHGCCDLGAVVVSRCIKDPFSPNAKMDWDLFDCVVELGVRFLDNVIEVTNYPLPQQKDEEFKKRRIGIGISGLADAMHMLGLRYGSPASCMFTEQVMQRLANQAYKTSALLAREKGKFPLYIEWEHKTGDFVKKLDPNVRELISAYGLRNGVLLTIAPTGTTSLAYGNISSGLEPVFAHSMFRKVKQADGSFKEYEEIAYGAKLAMHKLGLSSLAELPKYMNVCADVRIHEHVRIQEVCQRWVDASISKTINVPEDITYEDFRDVYRLAYDSGLKGCTTYRPSEVRGSILSTKSDTAVTDTESKDTLDTGIPTFAVARIERPELIPAATCKISWPGLSSSLYLTIGYTDGKPYEVFLNSKDQKALEWTMALTILMSLSLRMGVPLDTLSEEFQQVHALEGGWADAGDASGKQKYWPSLIAYLGHKMRQMTQPFFGPASLLQVPSDESGQPQGHQTYPAGLGHTDFPKHLEQCSKCHQYAVTKIAGCMTCTNCGDSKCS